MSQNTTSERKFAYGKFETEIAALADLWSDSPQYQNCQCPVSKSRPDTDKSILLNTHRKIIDMYDSICNEEYADGLACEFKFYGGTISESEAIDVWQQVIDELYESGDKKNYMEAVNIAHKLGWIEKLKLYNISDM